ncbi:M1 family metallopeptidase [Undibacterium flavidum]|uniref:Aminopeptidase N n=1 Tax=Undibacterium flavidum TaxID=2762297 RepID=A0ABR6Y5V2_9BURK|nr:M1 family metallopeptidase [Undibacterium flavidum]MBC3872006.1 M1 family peptidase [Undibacterium flavidum]
MKKILFLMLLAPLLGGMELVWAKDFYVKNPAIDVERYRYFIELNDNDAQIKGRAMIRIHALSALREFELDLGQRDESGKGMEVSSVRMAGQTLVAQQNGDKLKIQLAETLVANTWFEIEVTYQGEPKSGLFISNNKFGERVFFADNWPDHGHQWLPSIDHPSDKAAVEFIITAPMQYAVVANGLKIEESSLDGNRKLTHWREDVPIPVKVMVIGVARFAMQESARLNDISVTSWVFPQNRQEGFNDYQVAVKALDYFQKNVGPYPYKKLANVQSKTRFGGLENANTIFYFENSVTGKGEQEALIAHEIAHQWFGNSTTENDWHHVWLSEGFATYFANLYIEHTFGREAFVKQLLANREKVLRYHQKVMRPIIDTSIQDPKFVLTPNTYEKAAWMLHMLRHQLGDQVFWQGIRAYYAKFSGKNVLSADFQTVMEQVSGKDLSTFFQQWLYQAGYPSLHVQWKYDAPTKTLKLHVEQMQTQARFDFPLDIAVQTRDGKMELHTVRVNNKLHDFSIPLQGETKAISLDPLVKLLFEAKIENR